MALVIGGDISEIKVINPDAGAKTLYPIAGEDSEFDNGGYRNDDGGAIDGAGRPIMSKKRVVGGYSGTISNDDNLGREFAFCNAVQLSRKETTFIISCLNGSVYSATGMIAGDLKLNRLKATFPVKFVFGNIKQTA
jgi:hypothetical protein